VSESDLPVRRARTLTQQNDDPLGLGLLMSEPAAAGDTSTKGSDDAKVTSKRCASTDDASAAVLAPEEERHVATAATPATPVLTAAKGRVNPARNGEDPAAVVPPASGGGTAAAEALDSVDAPASRALNVGAAEVGAAEVGAAEVGAAEVGAAEVGADGASGFRRGGKPFRPSLHLEHSNADPPTAGPSPGAYMMPPDIMLPNGMLMSPVMAMSPHGREAGFDPPWAAHGGFPTSPHPHSPVPGFMPPPLLFMPPNHPLSRTGSPLPGGFGGSPLHGVAPGSPHSPASVGYGGSPGGVHFFPAGAVAQPFWSHDSPPVAGAANKGGRVPDAAGAAIAAHGGSPSAAAHAPRLGDPPGSPGDAGAAPGWAGGGPGGSMAMGVDPMAHLGPYGPMGGPMGGPMIPPMGGPRGGPMGGPRVPPMGGPMGGPMLGGAMLGGPMGGVHPGRWPGAAPDRRARPRRGDPGQAGGRAAPHPLGPGFGPDGRFGRGQGFGGPGVPPRRFGPGPHGQRFGGRGLHAGPPPQTGRRGSRAARRRSSGRYGSLGGAPNGGSVRGGLGGARNGSNPNPNGSNGPAHGGPLPPDLR
jgi:hypothetical protein